VTVDGGRIDLMAMRIDRVTEAQAIATIIDALERHKGGWVITPNLHHLREFARSPELTEPFARADLVVADGFPLVLASRIVGTPLPARVAGSDLIWSLSAEAALHARSIYLLGAAPLACAAAERRMRELYPGLRIAGCQSPPVGFEDDPAEMAAIRSRLMATRPDIVFVALGFPKQERLIAGLVDLLPSTWFLGVGASLDFIGGQSSRAPSWMIRLGMEWLHRLAQEPRRLWRRYVAEGLPFAARLMAYALRRRLSPRSPEVLPSPASPVARPRVVFTHGAVERERAAEVRALIEELERVAA
jgi:N-acetylglucosaminyldiphosphoundecaprenol N-acetyl-beta-D-mannosaminyltransferase